MGYGDVNWIQHVQKIVHWWPSIKMVMNFWAPEKKGSSWQLLLTVNLQGKCSTVELIMIKMEE
jgi:hypothetical protein